MKFLIVNIMFALIAAAGVWLATRPPGGAEPQSEHDVPERHE